MFSDVGLFPRSQRDDDDEEEAGQFVLHFSDLSHVHVQSLAKVHAHV